jgi:3-oxoacyl-[acyl-carrier protein] reductase
MSIETGLAGKSVVVTGAAAGIGRATAMRFAKEGAKVAAWDVAEAAGLADELKAAGAADAFAAKVNVADAASVNAAVADVVARWGRVDVLVNNAGIVRDAQLVKYKDGAVQATMTDEQWDAVVGVNLKGVFLCTRAVLKPMVERKWGRIINIASQLGHKGAAEMAHYAAAKAGVIGFTRSLAYEVARDNVTVNAICPGPIDTALFRAIPESWRTRKLAELPIGRAGTVEEIAPTAVLLASEEGAYYVGATMNPNGGDVML